MNPSGSGLLLVDRLYITASTSLLVIRLFRVFVSSWLNFGKLYVPRNLSSFPDSWISVVSVAVLPFSFLITLIGSASVSRLVGSYTSRGKLITWNPVYI